MKTKGNNPEKLFKAIKTNRAKEGSIIPGEEIFLLTAENSLNTLIFTEFKGLDKAGEIVEKERGRIKITNKDLTQLRFKTIQDLGSNEAKRLFIKFWQRRLKLE